MSEVAQYNPVEVEQPEPEKPTSREVGDIEKEELIEELRQNPMAIASVPADLRQDRDVALATASTATPGDAAVLQYLLKFRDDKEIVMAATESNSSNILLCSDKLMFDKDVQMALTRSKPFSTIKYARIWFMRELEHKLPKDKICPELYDWVNKKQQEEKIAREARIERDFGKSQ